MQSALARALSFFPTAVATLVTSRLIINHFSLSAFDSYALIISLIALIPLQDLGVGAAVTSSFAERGPRDQHSVRVALTAARILALSTVGLAIGSLLLALFGLWPTLLGAASGPNSFVAVAMVVYAVSFLPGLGQRMLLGVDRNHLTVVIQTLFTPLILLGTVVVIIADVASGYLMIVPPVAIVLVNLVTLGVGVRSTNFPLLKVIREIPRPRRFPGRSIRAISGPMLLITLAVPIALQCDRIVLSHVASKQAVANYSVVVQIFAPIAALIAATAQPLWPIYTRARSQGQRGPALARVLSIFCGATALVSTCLVFAADPIGHLIGGGHINLGLMLPLAAALSVTMQAAAYPVAMALMDPRGIRFISVCTVLALPINVGLSIILGKQMGAPGPLLATFIVGALVQTVPAIIYANRRGPKGRHRHDPKRAPDALTVQTISAMTGIELSIPKQSTSALGSDLAG
ncbi:MAG: hypothetical protein DLM57_02700 [Pseudonocardiales bacterium]|nr:MAG: hypothetical protein DLM57_02700 [Pseudonocardiales bacterium]